MDWPRYLPQYLNHWLVGSPHHIHSIQDFVEQATKVPGEWLSSYDVTAMFTSVPVEPALGIITDLLEKDNTLKERTVIQVKDIILLLEFCLKNTYFSFQDQFYEQVEGAVMGSRVSPIEANLYMEYLEQKALSAATHPPRMWLRYVDDSFVIQKEDHKQSFLEHINIVDLAIRFTVEYNKENGATFSCIPLSNQKPMVDCLSQNIGNPPTHTDQYLQWNSHHHLSAKYSGINTLTNKEKTVCTKPKLLWKKWEHLRKACTHCKYPKWAMDRVERRFTKPTSEVRMKLTTRALQVPSPPPMKSKQRVI